MVKKFRLAEVQAKKDREKHEKIEESLDRMQEHMYAISWKKKVVVVALSPIVCAILVAAISEFHDMFSKQFVTTRELVETELEEGLWLSPTIRTLIAAFIIWEFMSENRKMEEWLGSADAIFHEP